MFGPFRFGLFEEKIVLFGPFFVKAGDDVELLGKEVFVALVVERLFHLALERRKSRGDVVVGIDKTERGTVVVHNGIGLVVDDGVGAQIALIRILLRIGSGQAEPRFEVAGKVFVPRLGEDLLHFRPREEDVARLRLAVRDADEVVVDCLHIVAEPLVGEEDVAVGVHPDTDVSDIQNIEVFARS